MAKLLVAAFLAASFACYASASGPWTDWYKVPGSKCQCYGGQTGTEIWRRDCWTGSQCLQPYEDEHRPCKCSILSAGEIAGIVVGGVVGLVLIIIIIVWCFYCGCGCDGDDGHSVSDYGHVHKQNVYVQPQVPAMVPMAAPRPVTFQTSVVPQVQQVQTIQTIPGLQPHVHAVARPMHTPQITYLG